MFSPVDHLTIDGQKMLIRGLWTVLVLLSSELKLLLLLLRVLFLGRFWVEYFFSPYCPLHDIVL